MREVLFRGKRADNGEWVEGFLLKGNRTYIVTSEAINYMVVSLSYIASVQLVEVDPATVGQFTGLTDKNGKRIFEGDVIKTKTGRLCVVYWFFSPSFCGWDLKPVDTADNSLQTSAPPAYDLYLQEILEVIGNIHDNPDNCQGKRRH